MTPNYRAHVLRARESLRVAQHADSRAAALGHIEEAIDALRLALLAEELTADVDTPLVGRLLT